jgi:hypothetical protein
VRNGDVDKPPNAACDAKRIAREQFEAIVTAVIAAGGDRGLSFVAFERKLRDLLFALGRALVVLFLVVAEQRVTSSIPARLNLGARAFRRAPAQTRNLDTMFGVVR